MKRRGINRFDRELVRREQRISQRELVINLVVCIGIEYHTRFAGGRTQAADASLLAQLRECHLGFVLRFSEKRNGRVCAHPSSARVITRVMALPQNQGEVPGSIYDVP